MSINGITMSINLTRLLGTVLGRETFVEWDAYEDYAAKN